MNRCVNLDWVEVYCHEPADIYGHGIVTAERLRSRGWIVTEREYGTPLYHEMFYVAFSDAPNTPFLEVRRKPRTSSDGGAFVHLCSCHLRLTNLFCYSPAPFVILRHFILQEGYEFRSIKRIDICMDFNFFDDGEDPFYVLRSYMEGEIAKINQSKVSAYGEDSWRKRSWNSVKWGSPTSNISTKLYDKSMELKQKKMKTYIQDAWRDAGLNLQKRVWRVEFSIKAGQQGFKNKKSQEFSKMSLSMFDSREKLLAVFHSLAAKYFHFKKLVNLQDGTPQRKDRCPDKKLFDISLLESAYEPTSWTAHRDLTRIYKIVRNKCFELAEMPEVDEEVKDSAMVLVRYINSRFAGYM